MTRSAQPNPFGKCTEEVKTAIDEETKAALTALAFAANTTVSEYIRELLHRHVHGHAAVLRARMAGRE